MESNRSNRSKNNGNRLVVIDSIPVSRYAYFNFGGRPFHQATYKWSVVWRESKQPNESISRTSWICVGNLTMTTECLANVRAALLDEHQ